MKALEELGAINLIQNRINKVAKDIESKAMQYADIVSWELGEMLGLDFGGTGDDMWCRQHFAIPKNVEDECGKPFYRIY